MLFNSYVFLLAYLPLVLGGFFCFSRLHLVKAAQIWLLVSSLFFYGYWDIRFLPLLAGSILFNYYCGLKILTLSGASRKGVLLVGIVLDLGLLFYFKYSNFFLSTLLGQSAFGVILPLGISFFTFTQIAFLVDAFQGKTERSGLISYGLFVTIFPHLIAGPILHHSPMLQQFDSLRMYVLSWKNIYLGIVLFILGISKKVLLADNLAPLVKSIFDEPNASIPFLQAWMGALAYTLQLYFDFSGYSDMAVGLGLMVNLKLPINFNSPYQADSIIDFWRRWHITLSTFLRDYLYIPLGGSRNGKLARYRNLFITMLLGGLWHGAGWTFVLWGVCHGCFLMINHLWRDLKLSMPHWFAKAFTLLAVIVAWVIFRAPTVDQAMHIIQGMMGFHGLVLPEKYASSLLFLQGIGVQFGHISGSIFRLVDIGLIAILSIVVLFFPNSNEWIEKLKSRPLVLAAPCALLFFFVFLNLEEVSEFLYYQF